MNLMPPDLTMHNPDFDDEDSLLDDGSHPPDIEPLFDVVSFAITPRALDLLLSTGHDPWTLSARHQGGDWGSLDSLGCALNDIAVREGGRKMSVFVLEVPEGARPTICGEPAGDVVWQITEPTGLSTILTPNEYQP